MTTHPLLLITGATGKVGGHLIERLLTSPSHRHWRIRALVHNRTLPERDRLESMRGSISDRAAVDGAMAGVTHVVHLATCKETPEQVMDVAIKGLFWLLESARATPSLQRFVLMSGDASVGHAVYHRDSPVTEAQPHTAYPGCYALSKVLEEVMLEQYYHQYGLDGCCLRPPWIMEKDDLRMSMSFSQDVFGKPRWCDLVGAAAADVHHRAGAIALALDASGHALRRSLIHVSDVVDAIVLALEHPAARQQTFNIGMSEPFDYRQVAEHLHRTRGVPAIEVPTDLHSVWYDSSKARHLLGWRSRYDAIRLADESFDFRRTAADPRMVYYPG